MARRKTSVCRGALNRRTLGNFSRHRPLAVAFLAEKNLPRIAQRRGASQPGLKHACEPAERTTAVAERSCLGRRGHGNYRSGETAAGRDCATCVALLRRACSHAVPAFGPAVLPF